MSVNETVTTPPASAISPASKPETKPASCRGRTAIFAYDIAAVVVLLVVGGLYARHPEHFHFPDERVVMAIRAGWFGALGGVVIGLKGIYDHSCTRGDWDDSFALWHIGRPVSGGLAGLITLLLLLAANGGNGGSLSEPTVYAIAFIFGTQERRFFNFLSEVAGLVVRVPGEDQPAGLKGGTIQPSQARGGAIVLITGRGFAQGAKVTIGANPLENVIVGKDGTTIVGNVPAGVAGAVDVTIVNPGGERVILPDKFTYPA